MVLQRRLDYGFKGYQVPEVPRASRSPRGKGPIRKKLEGSQIRAFEILASVAGKLLQESEDSVPTKDSCGKGLDFVIDDTTENKQRLKEDPCEWGSCDEETYLCVRRQERQPSHTLNGFAHLQENVSYEINSESKSSGHSGRICFAKSWGTGDSRNSFGSSSNRASNSPLSEDFIEEKTQGVLKRKLENEPLKDTSIKIEAPKVLVSSEDLIKVEVKSPEIISPRCDANTSFSEDCKSHGPFLCDSSNVKVVSGDDDENFVGDVQPETIIEEFEHPRDASDRKIKNHAASRHWRVAPDMKVGGYSRNDGKLREAYQNGGTCVTHQGSEKIYPFKKRKFFDQRPLSTSDRGCNCECTFSSSDKRENGDNYCTGIGPSSSTTERKVSLKSNDCNVKLSIKSFKVPELFIEIPTTETVGSLKRTVMEAVTSILGNGLHVGILVQGKRVRDDNKTLLQTGISQDDKRHNLGFILEPKRPKLTYSPRNKDQSLISRRSQELTRHSASVVSQPGTSNVSMEPPVINTSSSVKRDLEEVPSSTSTDQNPTASQALITVPPVSMKALAVVPFHRKSGHSEYAQRRIRRPFSVPEVEALVQAVEKLGTGRWRDVKLRAFESAKHRTYVDLKDKWKTLVHTARISPQQRRGEPVPQELLDRVLAAHAYWSQRHAKQQLKAAVSGPGSV